MKHLLMIAIAFFTLNAIAQEELSKDDRSKKDRFTPEQIADLQTKRMALDLDLNDSQKLKIKAINLANAKERHAKKSVSREDRKAKREALTADERFKNKSERLDKALANKQKMKSILSDDQFTKWDSKRQRRGKKVKGMKRHKMKQRRQQKGSRHSKKDKN